jgi:hypothetical protein
MQSSIICDGKLARQRGIARGGSTLPRIQCSASILKYLLLLLSAGENGCRKSDSSLSSTKDSDYVTSKSDSLLPFSKSNTGRNIMKVMR